MIPSLKTMIDDPNKHDELAGISSMMSGKIKNTCSTDASCLKYIIPKYTSPNPLNVTIIKPFIVLKKSKAEVGLNHPLLAQ
ncbi:hypothetical protein JVT61DRAFT_1671 [Boletus reticuloceps]|uniref:Uncharacterized protein n=1 Tax=Boletus reticuloceps TaxID=495285 RepID=A0A8I3AAW4_9AGAM|nr:hypothetical protein JVT61DRAFT_1671 [Boletus reticuloceps]